MCDNLVESKSGKIAFLFLTIQNHNCPKIWSCFFKGIPTNLYSIYCHPKKPPTQPFLRNNVIRTLIPTKWGDISLVKATLLLLREALTDNLNQHFILLSDSCIPIIDFSFLRKTLSNPPFIGKSLLHYKHIANRDQRYSRLSPKIRSHLPWEKFYSQHQWMILNRKHSELCVKLSPTLLGHFNYVHAVDEHYFVTLFQLSNVLEKEILNYKSTYCNWKDKSAMHPKMFHQVSEQAILEAQHCGCFFFRKVSPKAVFGQYLLNCLTNFRKDKLKG